MQKRDWVFFFIVFVLGFLVFTMKSFADDFGTKPSLRCDGLWKEANSLFPQVDADKILLREQWVRTYAQSLRRFQKGEYILVHFHRKNFLQVEGEQKNYFFHEGYFYYWGTEIHDQKVVHLISKEGRDYAIAVPVDEVELSPIPVQPQDLVSQNTKTEDLLFKTLDNLLKKARIQAEDSLLKFKILTDSSMDFHFLDRSFLLVQNFLKKAQSWGFALGTIQILYQNEGGRNFPLLGPFVLRSRSDTLSAVVLMQKTDLFAEMQYTDSILLHEVTHALMGFTFPHSVSARFRTLDEAFADFLALHFSNETQTVSYFRNINSGVSLDISKAPKNLSWRSITRVTDLKAGQPHDNSLLYSRLLWKIREHMGADYIDQILPGLFKKISKIEMPKSWEDSPGPFISSTLGREVMMFHFFLAALRWELESHPGSQEALSFFQQKIQEMEVDSAILQTSYQSLLRHQ